MKRLFLLLCASLMIGMMTTTFAADDTAQKGIVWHVVSFKFKETATADQIKVVEKAFADLKTKIPYIKSYRSGTNISPEKLNKGFTHCFLLSFSNEQDRDAYLIHPDHKAFGKSLGPIISDVFVFDFAE